MSSHCNKMNCRKRTNPTAIKYRHQHFVTIVQSPDAIYHSVYIPFFGWADFVVTNHQCIRSYFYWKQSAGLVGWLLVPCIFTTMMCLRKRKLSIYIVEGAIECIREEEQSWLPAQTDSVDTLHRTLVSPNYTKGLSGYNNSRLIDDDLWLNDALQRAVFLRPVFILQVYIYHLVISSFLAFHRITTKSSF